MVKSAIVTTLLGIKETKRSVKIVIFENLIYCMDINAERSLIIKELEQIKDISFLRSLKHLIHYALKNEGHISIDQYNQELDEAEARVAQGEFYTQDEVDKKLKGGEEILACSSLGQACLHISSDSIRLY